MAAGDNPTVGRPGDVMVRGATGWGPRALAAVILGIAAVFKDSLFRIVGSSDSTKRLAFEVDGFTTGTTRTWTVPDRTDTFAGLGAQTFTGAQTVAASLTVSGAASVITATAAAPTATSGSSVLASFTTTANPASANSGNVYAQSNSAQSLAACAQDFTATANPGIASINAAAAHFGTGTVSFMAGGNFVCQGRLSGGNITRGVGIRGMVNNLGAITITDGTVLDASTITNTGGGAVTRAIGVAAERNTVGATNVGFYYGTKSSVTVGNWGFYNQTADANYLGTGQTSSGSTTDASSTTTGSLTTLGGFSYGAAKAMYGGSANLALSLTLSVAGGGIIIKEGSNATSGAATLSAGTVVVSTTKVTASSRIYLTVQSLGTVAVATPIAVTARIAGTSFTITSSSVTDTSVVAWVIIEPAP